MLIMQRDCQTGNKECISKFLVLQKDTLLFQKTRTFEFTMFTLTFFVQPESHSNSGGSIVFWPSQDRILVR